MSENRKRILGLAGENLSILGMKLNEVTGYKEVERLKEEVGEKGGLLYSSSLSLGHLFLLGIHSARMELNGNMRLHGDLLSLNVYFSSCPAPTTLSQLF
jgi:hypothetical protein